VAAAVARPASPALPGASRDDLWLLGTQKSFLDARAEPRGAFRAAAPAHHSRPEIGPDLRAFS
jgi:hypothetical protein